MMDLCVSFSFTFIFIGKRDQARDLQWTDSLLQCLQNEGYEAEAKSQELNPSLPSKYLSHHLLISQCVLQQKAWSSTEELELKSGTHKACRCPKHLSLGMY